MKKFLAFFTFIIFVILCLSIPFSLIMNIWFDWYPTIKAVGSAVHGILFLMLLALLLELDNV